MTLLLTLLPWIAIVAFIHGYARFPRGLERVSEVDADAPHVTVIVPARNEEANLGRCLSSLAASEYPAFDIIVVDDRSEDDSGAIAASHAAADARIRVVEGVELPEGWLGKPWACHQGAQGAEGELLLFTDADTHHAPDLLSTAVAGVDEEDADLLTLVGRQEMESFWERLVQPQVFMTMLFRFPNFERTARNARWRDAIANGQYLLFRREAYDAIGGHESVKDEVVEDLALAQVVKRAGLALRMRSVIDGLSTRMYRSLGGLIEGWSKNLVMAGQQTLPRPLRAVAAPVVLLFGATIWLLPPLVLMVSIAATAAELDPVAGFATGDLLVWSGSAYGLTALNAALFTHRMRGPSAYGLLYPIGAAMGTYIFARSWIRGRRVEWKGRTYVVPSAAERP